MSRRRCKKRRVMKEIIVRLLDKIRDPQTDGEDIERAQYEVEKIRRKIGE